MATPKKTAKKAATRPTPAKAAPPAGAKSKANPGSKRPMLFLHPAAMTDVKKHFEGAARAFETYFVPVSKPELVGKEDVALADAVAAALEGVVLSSDTDCEYYPCVLAGADMMDDDAFFAAVGIDPKEMISVGGDDGPRLETYLGYAKGKKEEDRFDTVQLLSNLGDEFESIDDYVTAEDQESYGKAAKLLERHKVIVGATLAADSVTKVVLTLAETERGAWAGVMSIRIDT